MTAGIPSGRQELPLSLGATRVPDRATFDLLARREDVPGQLGAEEMKFLIVATDTTSPELWFCNSRTFEFHYVFAVRALGIGLTLEEFNARTYFRDDRANLAGTLVAHDQFEPASGERGLYALEFWPTDPVRARHIELAYDLIRAAMPFAEAKLAYHPAGETQEALLREDEPVLRERGVRMVMTRDLYADVAYVALNLGEGYGVLSVVEPTSGRPPTVRDVALFRNLPNDLGHVAGVISATPQTPLSHVNLKAKQNDTPNAYLRGAETDPRVMPLLGQVVRYEVTPDEPRLSAATPAEVEAWLERVRPPHPQVPPRNLEPRVIADIDGIGHADVETYGAKAANLGELRKLLPAGVVPDGYAIPFGYYDTFMSDGDLYQVARRIVDDPALRGDAAARDEALARLRKKIRRSEPSPEIAAAITELQSRFVAGSSIRCRSSTNNEDLPGFNGAGLYDSFTHRPDEGNLVKTVRQVWASLWNLRAFDERDFHRIDHFAAAMGVLVHPNLDDELANGVAVTKNPYDPNWPGFYINVQVGESLVTNPDPDAIPDELLISRIGPHGEEETQYIRHSSLTNDGAPVMTAAQLADLTSALSTIQQHFRIVYEAHDDPAFAMDVEFKVALGGGLVIKQARPWVD
jgi:hypothetical protein